VTTSVSLLPGLLGDLALESADLDDLVADLSDEEWARPTPAAGWTIAHQIAHLAWTDDQALLAVRSPEDFSAAMRRASSSTVDAVDAAAQEGARARPAELLARWRAGRAALAEALEQLPEGTRIPWYGTSMSSASMATARLMETWAHGQDVADALDVTRDPSDRLRHVAHLGVRTRDYSFAVNGMAPPREDFRIELVAPSGELWAWGPVEATQRLTGDGRSFAMLVTQRIHRDDADLLAQGDDVERWLRIAQAFAGPPGTGRPASHT
jgi:uncharacterized protein (TIGR03084 family)